jgi:ABC-type transporter lipoprotein component MlaA
VSNPERPARPTPTGIERKLAAILSADVQGYSRLMPHPRRQGVASFPKHFNFGDQQTVMESTLTADPEQAVRQFLAFAAGKITAGS